jgi:hypothetical protein
MGVLGMELQEDYDRLEDQAIDVAEQMLQSHDDDAFADLLDEFDIHIDRADSEELLSRCHSAVVTEIAKFVDEKLAVYRKEQKGDNSDEQLDDGSDPSEV